MRDDWSNDVETAAYLAREDAHGPERPHPSEYMDPPPNSCCETAWETEGDDHDANCPEVCP